ncbi:pPIWI_RE module domain-containing protein [Embleya sp. NPDC050493]|uniref:pPIWI_RE module domain-containing protein n=1 Tax=Embleya sp. NPDC050493 TaxID=3363989 RepID=UPI0037935DBD
MGFTYDRIRRAAYLSDGESPLKASYNVLGFPEQWRATLLDLCNLGRGAAAEPLRAVPTYHLDGVLQTLAPDLIVRPRVVEPQRGGADPWLYSPVDLPHPLPDAALEGLLNVWVKGLRPEPEHASRVGEILRSFAAEPPSWSTIEVDLLDCPTTHGGTANPEHRQFQLTPDYLARRVAALPPFDTGAGTLTFRAVPRGPHQKGAELMSQPLPYEAKRRTWWFSIVLAFTLHTVPFSATPRVHVHSSIRRWATRTGTDGLLHLPHGVKTSVYLRPTIPWLPGAPTSHRYAIARVAWDRKRRQHSWRGGDPAGLLQALTLSGRFPEPADLLSSPEQWIGDGPGVRAAIVYSTRMGAHAVGAGLMSHQRSQLVEWLEQALPLGLRPTPELSRSGRSSGLPLNPRPKPAVGEKPAEEIRSAEERRTAWAASVSDDATDTEIPIVEIRLLWQTERMRDEAVLAFERLLALKGGGVVESVGEVDVREWSMPDLTVRLRSLRLSGGLADDLGIDPLMRPRRRALAQAIDERRGRASSFLLADGASPRSPSLALVELDRRADFSSGAHDPKYALRLGCADAGVLTQFVSVPKKVKGYDSEKTAEHRAFQGWADGLRQLGLRVHPEHSLGGQLPEGLRYAAVWMVKRRADGPTRVALHMPVAVLVTPDKDAAGRATVQGWDKDAKCWIPYPELLLRLVQLAELPCDEPEIDAGESPDGPETTAGSATPRVTYWDRQRSRDEQRKETARFLQHMIRSLRGEPTVLLTHAQNSRSHWPWLQDGQVVRDLIKTGHAPAGRLDADLRLVRVRATAGWETPQWWGVGAPTGINGLPAGMWAEPVDENGSTTSARVFYSTTEKPFQFKAAAVKADKLAPRLMERGVRKGEATIDTGTPAWNSGLVEIAVLGCHEDAGDDAEALALAVHQLRYAPDFPDALALPLPLHLTALVQEYVLPTETDAESLAEEEAGGTDPMGSCLEPDQLQLPGLE